MIQATTERSSSEPRPISEILSELVPIYVEEMQPVEPKILGLSAMASRLKVPMSWLKEQVDLGTIPSDRAGEGYVFEWEATVASVSRPQRSNLRNAIRPLSTNKQ